MPPKNNYRYDVKKYLLNPTLTVIIVKCQLKNCVVCVSVFVNACEKQKIMPQGRRKVPFSGKQKKQQIVAKRQAKRKSNNILVKIVNLNELTRYFKIRIFSTW